MEVTNINSLYAYLGDLFKQIQGDESPLVKRIESVVNVFETGKVEGGYTSVVVMNDGKNGSAQVTYGEYQTTEQGNLPKLLDMYIQAHGVYADAMIPYVERMVHGISLAKDFSFRRLLQNAGGDQVMKDVQDRFFMRYYLKPAVDWYTKAGMTYPLSLLVIYDSFIHSGGILTFIRNRFPEKIPAMGGDEKRWIRQYVAARLEWLQDSLNPILRKTVYRMNAFTDAILKDNWNMDKPIDAHGTEV